MGSDHKKTLISRIGILLVAFVLSVTSMLVLAQVPNDSTLQQQYQSALIAQEEQEARVGYSGDDEIIRNRLNLAPKIGSYEEWKAKTLQSLKQKQSNASEVAKLNNDISKNHQTTTSDEALSVKNLLIAYLVIVGVLWFLKRKSFLFKLLYWVVGFPFALLGLIALAKGSAGSSSYSSYNDEEDDYVDNSSKKKVSAKRESSKPQSKQRAATPNRERVEIQYQSKLGQWRTLHVTSNNLDQSISHAMDDIERRIRNMSDTTGHIRAKGKDTGTIYDIRH